LYILYSKLDTDGPALCIIYIFTLVRGYLAVNIFHRGYITEKRLRTTALYYSWLAKVRFLPVVFCLQYFTHKQGSRYSWHLKNKIRHLNSTLKNVFTFILLPQTCASCPVSFVNCKTESLQTLGPGCSSYRPHSLKAN